MLIIEAPTWSLEACGHSQTTAVRCKIHKFSPSSFVVFPEFVVAAVRVCCAANLILKNVPDGRVCLTFGPDVTENSSNPPNPYPPSAKLS